MRPTAVSWKPVCGVRWMVVATLALLCALPASAQILYGSLVGTVTDETGLSVPGAIVTITQTETNQSRGAATNATGGYNFSNVAPGTYQVVVTLTGFKPFTARSIVVRQNNAVRVDAKLTVGSIEESIVVSGTAALLQTETAAVQTVMTSEQMENLPTSGRAFQTVLTLMAGVAQPNYIQAGGINNPARSMAVSVNGQPPTNTVFRFDGITATNQWFPELQAYSPGTEAIETVSVVTNSFDADQGMAGGAAVNVQIKSGTNRLHGSAFEYLTDARLRNRNYFLPPGDSKGTETKNIFGGTLGGPIVRNKFFYFASVESTVQDIANGVFPAQIAALTPGIRSLPPADLRAGNFSNTNTVLYDPLTGTATGAGRIPFAFQNCPGLTSTTDPRFASCNYIPASRINPIAVRLLNALVPPTLPGYTNNYFASGTYSSYVHKVDTKLTWTPSSRLNVNSRVSYLPNVENNSGIFPSPDGARYNPLSIGRLFDSNVRSASWSATTILSPNFVVDGVAGFTRQHTNVEPEGPKDTCWGAEFGIPNACQPPFSRDRATPLINITGWASLGNSPMRDYLDSQYNFVGNAGWTKGSHNVKFGADIQRMHLNHYETQVATLNFTGGASALNGGPSPNNFNGFADFLLGLPQSRNAQAMSPLLSDEGAEPERPATLRTWAFGTYLRDQWQVNRKMTASVGLRWEYYPFPRRADRGLEIFDFTTNRLQICGVSGANAQLCDIKVQKDLFTPRLGLAYRPTETMVVRVGFSRNPQNDNVVGRVNGMTQAFPAIIVITENGANSFTPAGSLDTGVPLVPQVNLQSGTVSLPRGAGVTAVDNDYVRGTITSYNVTLQKLLPHQMSVQIGYVANRQDRMSIPQNVNYGQIGGGAASQPFNQAGLPDGLRTTSAMTVLRPLGRVTYDSLQASVNRRLSSGFQFTAAYTYAHTIDWWADNIPIPEYWDLNKGEQSGIYAAVPHKFDTSVVYELPFGPGRKFLSDGALLGKIVGGWQLNAFVTVSSGKPFTVGASSASLNAPGSGQRADQVKEKVEITGFAPGASYFDVTAFKPVTEARFGTAEVNSLRGPGVANLDLSLFRTVTMRTMHLQVRLEAFNVTNTPHFANPANLNVSNLQLNPDGSVRNLNGFGVISSTQSIGREYDERYLRLGLRLSF